MSGLIEMLLLVFFKLTLWGAMGSPLAIGAWLLIATAIIGGLLFGGPGADR